MNSPFCKPRTRNAHSSESEWALRSLWSETTPGPWPGAVHRHRPRQDRLHGCRNLLFSLPPSLSPSLSLRLPLCSSSSPDYRRLQPSCVSLVTFSPPKRIAECKAARSLKARGHVADAAQLGTHVRKLQGRENGPIWLAVPFSKTLHACECVHASACVRARTGSEAPVTETRA